MAWKKAATSSDRESDRSLLGTSSLLCWEPEPRDGVKLLTLDGDDEVEAIITTERGNCSLLRPASS